MTVQRSDIRKGMQVLGADGEVVGTVIAPPPSESHGPVDPVPFGVTEDERRAEAERTRAGIFEVEDPGTFGVGAGGLRIPISAVLRLDPGQRILLDCTRDDARRRYGPAPSLEFDPSGPPPP